MKNLIERIEARLDDWGAKLEKKNIEYPVDLICGILFLVIGIVLLLIMPRQVQISEKDVVNGRAFPTMLIPAGCLCGCPCPHRIDRTVKRMPWVSYSSPFDVYN